MFPFRHSLPSLQAADQLKQCLSTAQDADPVVKELAVTAERCFDRSEDKERCDEMAGKCSWTAADEKTSTPQYCGVAPLHVMMTLIGPDGIGKIAAAAMLCGGVPPSKEQCEVSRSCSWNADKNKCGVDAAGALADAIKSTAAKAYLNLISRCGKGSSDPSSCAAAGGTSIDCVYGPAAGSTNFIPKEYGGDGGDGAGGWMEPSASASSSPSTSTT